MRKSRKNVQEEPLLRLSNALVSIGLQLAAISLRANQGLVHSYRFQRSGASWISSHLIHPGLIKQTFIYYEPKFIFRCLDAWKVHAFNLINHDDISHCICR